MSAAVAFVVNESLIAQPMVSCALAGNREFAAVIAVTFDVYAGVGGCLFLLVVGCTWWSDILRWADWRSHRSASSFCQCRHGCEVDAECRAAQDRVSRLFDSATGARCPGGTLAQPLPRDGSPGTGRRRGRDG